MYTFRFVNDNSVTFLTCKCIYKALKKLSFKQKHKLEMKGIYCLK